MLRILPAWLSAVAFHHILGHRALSNHNPLLYWNPQCVNLFHVCSSLNISVNLFHYFFFIHKIITLTQCNAFPTKMGQSYWRSNSYLSHNPMPEWSLADERNTWMRSCRAHLWRPHMTWWPGWLRTHSASQSSWLRPRWRWWAWSCHGGRPQSPCASAGHWSEWENQRQRKIRRVREKRDKDRERGRKWKKLVASYFLLLIIVDQK